MGSWCSVNKNGYKEEVMPREYNDIEELRQRYNARLSNDENSFVISTEYSNEEIQRLTRNLQGTTTLYIEDVPHLNCFQPTNIGFAPATCETRITCAVCGEEFIVPPNSELGFICPKCKKAVMKMRSMMSEEDLR